MGWTTSGWRSSTQRLPFFSKSNGRSPKIPWKNVAILWATHMFDVWRSALDSLWESKWHCLNFPQAFFPLPKMSKRFCLSPACLWKGGGLPEMHVRTKPFWVCHCLSKVWFLQFLPSGKLSHNYGTSPFLVGKSTISMAIFNSSVKLPEGISH